MQIIGGKFQKILKIIPCVFSKTSDERQQYFQFQNDQKLKCKHPFLSDITVELRDKFDKLIQFVDGSSTCLVLKFTSYNETK